MAAHPRRRSARFSLAAFGLGAAVLAAPAHAGDGFHPLDSTLKFMNLKTDAGAMPDFVEQSRPDAGANDYVPIGRKPPDRALKVKTPAEIKAMTAELDAAHAAQLAGKRPQPMGVKPVDPKAPRPKPATVR